MYKKCRRLVFNCGSFRLQLGRRPHLMGIINLTNDSFSDGGKFNTPAKAFRHAKLLLSEGADIIDLGAESSRPGSKPVSAGDEISKLLPALEKIRSLNVPVSVDTYKPEVAEKVIREGADIINDITGCSNPEMRQTVARSKAGIIIMHMQGNPGIMQKSPRYKNVVTEVKKKLLELAELAIASGIERNRIVLDPGIGFGKTVQHNLQLINRINELSKSGYPVLAGPSRKSFIGAILEKKDPADREWGTAAAVAMCIAGGANILRVHDVQSMSMVSRVTSAIVTGSDDGGKFWNA